MQNIEIKYTLPDPQGLRQRLKALPEVRFQFRRYQKDIYFKTAQGRLKIRVQEGQPPCLIEYYRPDRSEPRISDFTLTPLTDYQQTLQALQAQRGILAEVEKWRELHLYRNVRIHIDEVKNLGWFVEFESVISPESGPAEAQANLEALLAFLAGYLGEVRPGGYLELLLQQEAAASGAKQRIVLGTHNTHKLLEISQILHGLPVEILTLNDFPDLPEAEETGQTFVENALLKARAAFAHTGLFALADDSGLEVEALHGAPGIYSARYAGVEKDYAANNRKLLEALKDVPEARRGAQFRCVAAIVGPGLEEVVEEVVRGRIIHELRGNKGFGYDPLFVPEGYAHTFGELGEEIKNRISHRARAFRKAREILEKVL